MASSESKAGVEPADVEQSLEQVMAEHEAALLRYATRILRDPDAARDVVQDTFIRLCRAWRNGSPPTRQLRAWLYRVTHNKAVDHIRHENRLRLLHQKQAEEIPESSPPGQRRQLETRELWDLTLKALGRLKPAEQQVVLLRLQEGLSYREIAEVTKRSEGNVGCILHHAVKKLSLSLRKTGAI